MKLLLTLLTFTVLLNTYSQEKSKLMQEGYEYFVNEQYELALQKYQEEYKNNPSIDVKFTIAQTHAEMDEVDKAKPVFLEIVKGGYEGSIRAMSLNNLGSCYLDLNQPDSAYYYYDKGIVEFPEMSSNYFNKGQLLYSESKFNQAKPYFDKAIELESDDWFYYQKRLEVCFALQDYQCALNDLIKVNELNPAAKNEMNIAYCYSMLERYEKADSMYLEIYDENNAFFLNNYGMNKHNLGETEEGKKIIMKSISLQPSNSYAYRNLAVIALDDKDKKEACIYLNKAKSLGFAKHYGKEVGELLKKHCE